MQNEKEKRRISETPSSTPTMLLSPTSSEVTHSSLSFSSWNSNENSEMMYVTKKKEMEKKRKMPLHVLISSITLIFLVIVLAISLSSLFTGSFNSVLRAIDVVAHCTVLEITGFLEADLKRSTNAVSGLMNASKIIGNPYEYNETTTTKGKIIMNLYKSHLFRYAALLREGGVVLLRFTSNNCVLFAGSFPTFDVKSQICSSVYSSFVEAPKTSPPTILDKLDCYIAGYNKSTLQPLPSNYFLVKIPAAIGLNSAIDGPAYNHTLSSVMKSKINNLWFPQLEFRQVPVAGAINNERELFLYRYGEMVFNNNNNKPFAFAISNFDFRF